MLRILLVDDHILLREALKLQLSSIADNVEIHEADHGGEAFDLFERYSPELTLLDVDLPDGHAFPLVERMRRLRPGCRVLFLTGYDYDEFIEHAIRVGVHGYVLKSDGVASLLDAIRIVRDGGHYFSDRIARRLEFLNGKPRLTRPRSEALARLTQRERELLACLGRGASLKEAAAMMQVSYKTADNQKANLMRKLDIHDRVELARFAIREGLISA